MEMSPLVIEVLLHYYYSPSDHRTVEHAPNSAMIQSLVDAGMLQKSTREDRKYEGVHEALQVYVDALKQVKLPVKHWIIPTSK